MENSKFIDDENVAQVIHHGDDNNDGYNKNCDG